MLDIVLVHPEIPPNTGNAIRLSANVGARLHLVEPLGFDLSDKQLKRAGLDYHDLAHVTVHKDWAACRAALAGKRFFALTSRGTVRYDTVRYTPDDVLVFGCETAGLPQAIRDEFEAEHCLRVPMLPGNRSINLSNTVALVAYEAWRQHGFAAGI
ncbi:tRNA (cytidine(34)-2'-O)-methyltransferase [Niveibacterium umoris]|uniref:tRNA (cytidine(34)-2'-O)-methyltransferase n=1 Tax=Niveibacterium umoris TaxID=1193620 RepID=A0A840BSI0_9RHOO|nr:tRNA (cytidine(34)-2'-O)-methyltransferase [Niveibacterium umoris]MBB4014632.1 tRNA (cytidine/uridine-2'-O-)-methyltransferase [Niveibacterium umoris]